MYRYNLLHRRSILNSHKTTLTKRLIGTGFYDSSLDSLNINVSSLKALNPNWESSMVDLYSASYKSFFEFNPFGKSLTSSNPYNLNTISPNSLSFLEESFFWTLKRFTIFNTLPSLDRENTLRFKSKKLNIVNNDSLLLERNWLNLYLTASQAKS